MNTVVNSSSMLDTDELLHLALNATDQDKPEESLNYLKRALEISPDNGKVQYMLGAVHAELKMYDRAIEEMAKAIELEPTLYTAHFQLGLLYLTSARFEEAEQTWSALDALDTNDPLYLFKTGMLHLIKDEFEESIHCLEQGIQNNVVNTPLNNDMQRIIVEAKNALHGEPALGTSSNAQQEEAEPASKGRHVLLSAYQDDDEDTKN